MPSTASSLYDLAAELLTQSAAILATTSAGAPTIQYVSHSAPALDCCGQLTVHAGAVSYGPFNPDQVAGDAFAQANKPVVPVIPLFISVFRCATAVPQGGTKITLPQSAKMTADAQLTYRDIWTLWCGIRQLIRSNQLFPSYPCRPFMANGASVVDPGGGCIGWVMQVTVELDGFDPMP